MRLGYGLEPGGIFLEVMNNLKDGRRGGNEEKRSNRNLGCSRLESASDQMPGEISIDSDLRVMNPEAITDDRAAE